jgi:hypothetical protein
MKQLGKRGSWPLTILVSSIGLLLAPSALAVGLGGYFEYGYSDGNVNPPFTVELDFETDRYGGGFVLDTNVARDSLINYRVAAGYQHSTRSIEGDDVKSHGFSLSATCGFGIHRDPRFRVWVGPSVRLMIDDYYNDGHDLDLLDSNIGGGLQAGVNFHTGDLVSVSMALGYTYMYVSGTVDGEGVGPAYAGGDQFNGTEHLVTVGISILFRSPGDRFDAPP